MNRSRLALGILGLAAAYGLYRASHPKIPAYIRPVADFDLHRYLGQWYEIARLDSETGPALIQTFTEYSLRWNGSIKMVSGGFDPWQSRFVRSVATARFQCSQHVAALKVSSLWPFYRGYNIVDLDPDYRWAIIVGSDRRSFQALSREPVLEESLRLRIVARAVALGIRPLDLVWVQQEVTPPAMLAEMGSWAATDPE